jgi:hypothetical protein
VTELRAASRVLNPFLDTTSGLRHFRCCLIDRVSSVITPRPFERCGLERQVRQPVLRLGQRRCMARAVNLEFEVIKRHAVA